MKTKFFYTYEFTVLIIFVVFSVAIVALGLKHKSEIQAKDAEIYAIRSKVNNYLLATGAYDRKASETLSLMKSLGIVKFYYD